VFGDLEASVASDIDADVVIVIVIVIRGGSDPAARQRRNEKIDAVRQSKLWCAGEQMRAHLPPRKTQSATLLRSSSFGSSMALGCPVTGTKDSRT
jgi:hypothetical protein